MNLVNDIFKKISNKRIYLILFLSIIPILLTSELLKQIIWVRITGIVLILLMVMMILEVKKKEGSYLTISTMFIVFLNIFHFGNVFITILDPNYEFMVLSFVNHKEEIVSVTQAILFCYITVIFIYAGIFLYMSKKKTASKSKTSKMIKEKFTLSHKELIMFSMLIIIISFPLQLYQDVTKIVIALSSDYLSTYNFYFPGVLIQIGSFYIVGFILLMVAYKDSKKSMYIFLFIIFYQCLMMISGNRGRQVLSIVVVTYIYFFFIKKVNIKKIGFIKILAVLVCGYILMNAVINISYYRMNIGNDPIEFIKLCLLPKKNIVFAVLDEFGYTLYTVVLEMERVTQFGKGLTYVGSLTAIFPTVFPFQEEVLSFSDFTANLGYGGIGGSIIGELYYNFSWIGSILGSLIGLLVGWFSKYYKQLFEENRMFLFSIMILPSISLLWWIRDSFLNIPRMIVYGVIIMTFLYWITKSVFKVIQKRNKQEEKVK